MMGKKKNTGPVTLTMTLEACFHRKLKKLLNKEKQGHVMGALREAMAECEPSEAEREGWKEAAIAWNVCASIHQQYAKGKDPFFTTRRTDYLRHHLVARQKALATAQDTVPPPEPIPEASAKDARDDVEVLADTARGSKFRPVDWHDTSATPPKLIGWGVERKPPDGRFYRPVLVDGGLSPFKTKKEAAEKCRELTEKYK